MVQWIARRTSNPEAVGSSPTERPVNMAREGITIQICATSIEKCLAIPHMRQIQKDKAFWTILISNVSAQMLSNDSYILGLHLCGRSLLNCKAT